MLEFIGLVLFAVYLTSCAFNLVSVVYGFGMGCYKHAPNIVKYNSVALCFVPITNTLTMVSSFKSDK